MKKKTNNQWMILVAFLFLLMVSCRSEYDNSYPRLDISNQGAMEFIQEALLYSTAGLAYDLAQSAGIADLHLLSQEAFDSCGETIYLDLTSSAAGVIEHSVSKIKIVHCSTESVPLSVIVNGRTFSNNSTAVSDFTFRNDSSDFNKLLVSGHYSRKFTRSFSGEGHFILYNVQLIIKSIVLNRNQYSIQKFLGSGSFISDDFTDMIIKPFTLTLNENGSMQIELGAISKTIFLYS